MSSNEILTGVNEPDHFVLALVDVSRNGLTTVRYLRRPFEGRSGDFGFEIANANFTWSAFWERASAPY